MFAEKLSSKEKRILKSASLGLMGAMALSGCSSTVMARDAPDMLPIERYGVDYMGIQDCLVGSPYAVYAEYDSFIVSRPKNSAAVSYDGARDIFTATPYGGGPALQLTGFDQTEETVRAYTVGSQNILDAYGCETIKYDEKPLETSETNKNSRS